MNKLNKIAALVATMTVAGAAFAQNVDNWRATDGTVWKNGTNEYCWRDTPWTPGTGVQGCDGVPAPAAPAAAPAPAPAAAPAPAPAAAVVPAAPATEKVSFAADAFFDFDKATLKPEGKAKLDDLADKVKGITLEVIIAVGHTDSVGADGYNQKLSEKRSEAVKSYLVGKGVEASRVYVEGKGEKQPVADNKSADGRAKNRRVEIEVVGTRAK
ncbi:MAG: OmpA family protein [Burkholderiales bacterium]|nr:OmpA family protein [Burkholderiales bacterium]MBH2015168.1 OmpA family protein [Burkholderiales bacterium]